MIPPLTTRPGPVASLDRLIDRLFAGGPIRLIRGNRLLLMGHVFNDEHMMEIMLRILPIFSQARSYRRYHGVYAHEDLAPLLATVPRPSDPWVRDRRIVAASCVLRFRDRTQVKPQPFVADFAYRLDWLFLGHMPRDFDALPDPDLTQSQIMTGHGVVELLAQPAFERVMAVYLDAGNNPKKVQAGLTSAYHEPHIMEARRRYANYMFSQQL
jgi:hypothetical protein